jgi:O-methyltransferase
MAFDLRSIREILRNRYNIELITKPHLDSLRDSEIIRGVGVFPVEFSPREIEICKYITDNKLTMAPREAVINTMLSAKYVVEQDLPGDFVECGVWRGGNALAAKLVFEDLGSPKGVWLFDTFKGMTEPTKRDVRIQTGQPALMKFVSTQEADFNRWCYASLEEVKNNFKVAGADLSAVRFIEGDILQTLQNEKNTPSGISVLRLDTDWYESTKIELETLYPILTKGGILIIDDYGCWDGCRKAVDEFFNNSDFDRPFFQVVYVRGTRTGIKN